MSTYLVTGAAGFIGSRVADMLLDEGHTVIGWDNLNDAYDVRMKENRLGKLKKLDKFTFSRLDISDRKAVDSLPGCDGVINLAARAGVRASVDNPWVYYESNVIGTLNLLELSRQRDIPKFLTASTAGVYGDKAPMPTPETADTNHPLQPYAASKKANELMAHTYSHLYGLPTTGLRFFTVYGPWGRPDMAMWLFTEAILAGKAFIRGGKLHYPGGTVENLYEAGAARNIATFYGNVTEGRFDNPTVPRAIDGVLTSVLGREAAAHHTRLTMEQVIQENKKLEVNLRGLKA